jgi:uncharacterized cupredoxin-like copper-binding protein
MRQALVRTTRLAIVGVALSAVAGCATSRAPTPADNGRLVRVSERDFHISAPKRVSSGDVRIAVRNKGPVNHEFIVVRTRNSRLPLRPDGSTVDEEGLEKATLGAVEPAAPGSVHHLRLHLAPGRYELFCNMSGHYLGGMHARLVVR